MTNTAQLEWSVEQEINDVNMGRPHVVLLGAGASLAAFPKGDKQGLIPPLMNDLVKKIGLSGALTKNGVDFENKDFEAIYSSLTDRPELKDLREEIEGRIRDYFRTLSLPNSPTLYDVLVLSLRKKDLIATF